MIPAHGSPKGCERMKRICTFLLAGALLLTLAGCRRAIQQNLSFAPPTTTSGEEASATTSGKMSTKVEYCAQYIRTNVSGDCAIFPSVRIIHSFQELKDYYNTWHEIFDLERKEKIYADTTIGFLDACDQYDEAFFEKNFLVFVLLEEASGSIRHAVSGVEQTGDQKLSISVDRKVPEVGTDDMAQWHIILELSRDVMIESAKDAVLIVDGKTSYIDDKIVQPQTEAAFKEPPDCTLITQEGSVVLKAAGFDWTYENPDGTAVAIIADQAGRPLPRESLVPVTVNGAYAETVYVPAGSTEYAATNSLGYLVKLDWGAAPSSVTYSCWPDTVWENENTPAEAVISHENFAFYAKPGGYVYEIAATWEDTSAGYHGSANYYVFIIVAMERDEENHLHMAALRPQTVADPIIGYCGNTQTTLYIGQKEYTFMFGNSVTLTDLLVNLDYKPDKVCRCMAQYRVDTEFGLNYQIHLDYGFVRCEKGQAELTVEQLNTITEIVKWAETTNGEYVICD